MSQEWTILELQAGMGELRAEVQGSFMHELQQRDETWEAAMAAMRAEMAEMKGKLVELEAARVNGVITVQSRADAPLLLTSFRSFDGLVQVVHERLDIRHDQRHGQGRGVSPRSLDQQGRSTSLRGGNFLGSSGGITSWKASRTRDTFFGTEPSSCDGLVCLAIHGGFLLYNPTTKESRNLPGSGLVSGDDFFHGYGYDSSSNDYKIV